MACPNQNQIEYKGKCYLPSELTPAQFAEIASGGAVTSEQAAQKLNGSKNGAAASNIITAIGSVIPNIACLIDKSRCVAPAAPVTNNYNTPAGGGSNTLVIVGIVVGVLALGGAIFAIVKASK